MSIYYVPKWTFNWTEQASFYVVFAELGDEWGAIVFESEVEYNFIKENLRDDQNQEYFINGSFHDESHSIGFSFSFHLYTPRQSGNKTFIIFFSDNICKSNWQRLDNYWEGLYIYLG